MQTHLRYLHAGRLQTQATVLAIYPVGEFEEDDRPSVVLSETPMQHETSDRVADRGWIDGEPVVQVIRSRLGQVLHHIAAPPGRFRVGQQVQVKVDLHNRDLQARLLCAGRLIEMVGPVVFPDLDPVGADYRPHRAKVEFGAAEFVPPPDFVRPGVCREIERCINLDLPVECGPAGDASFRRVRIGDFRPFSCTGVYPRSLKAIRGLAVTNVAVVVGLLQVRYRMGGPDDGMPTG